MAFSFIAFKPGKYIPQRWGILFLPLALGAIAALVWITFQLTPADNPDFYNSKLPKLGIAFSICVLLVGQFSYPRIHNLKIYFMAYATALVGAMYFVFHHPLFSPAIARPNPGFLNLLFLLSFLNHLAIAFLPPFIKYRWTRRITYFALALQAIAAYIFGYQTDNFGLLARLETTHDPLFSGILAIIGIIIISHLFIGGDFYLSGILCGSSLFLSTAWTAPSFFSDYVNVRAILFAAWPLFVLLGIIIHWFSRMEHRVVYDPLTQLYNRHYCNNILAEQTSIPTALPFCIAMVDIDHFKKVNDTYGHRAGDDILSNTAAVIKKNVLPGGIVCRYGGEEIIIFLPHTNIINAAKILEKVRAAVQKSKVATKRKQVGVTVSIGVAERKSMSVPLSELVASADKSLYTAKKGGRNQIRAGKKQLGLSKNTRAKTNRKKISKKAAVAGPKRARKKPQLS